MVALRQVELAIYRGIGRQRGRSFCAFARVFARTENPCMLKYIDPAAKRVVADLLSQKLQMYLVVEKNQDSCKECGRAISEKTIR